MAMNTLGEQNRKASALPAPPFSCYHVRSAGRAGTKHPEAIMAKSKEARSTIKLKSEASDHCYFTQKNRNNTKERISLRKFDPIVRRHVMYKEASKV
jgi:large subunit ribosomal protein L33